MSDRSFDVPANVADILPDSIAVLDTKGTILWCNKTTYDLTQQPLGEIIGKRFMELTSLRAQDVPKYVKIFASLLKGNSIDPFVVSWKRADGTELESEISVQLTVSDDGSRLILVVARDLTKEAKMREALRASEERFRGIAEQISDIVYMGDEKGNLSYISPQVQELLGYDPEEMLGDWTRFLTNNPINKKAVEMVQLSLSGETAPPYYIEILHKDGSRLFFENNETPIKDENGNVTGIIGAARNVTERKRTEERYREIFLNAPVGIYRTDTTGNVIDCNQVGATLLGYDSPEDLIGKKKIGDHYLDPHRREELLDELNKHGEVHDFQMRFKKLDGTSIWFEISSRLFPEEGYLETIGVDISERKAAEINLKRSEERYRRLFDSMRDGIASVNKDGVLTEWNEAFQWMMGYDDDELSQMTYVQITPERWHEIEETIIREQVDVRGFSDLFEKEYIHKNGDVFPVELRIYALKDEDGSITGYWAMVRDITQRVRSMEALQTSELRYRELMRNLPAGVGIADLDEKLVMVNPELCRILGYEESEEVLGMSVLDTIDPADHEKVISETQTRMKGESSSYEVRVIRKDGTRRLVRISAVPRRNKFGEVDGSIGLMTDITERQRSQEALKASEKRYRDLLGQLPLGVAIADLSEKVELVNEAMAGIIKTRKDDLIGSNMMEYLAPGYLSVLREQTKRRTRGVISTYDVEMIRTDGERRNVRISAGPKYDEDGKVSGSVGVFEDITEEKLNEAIRSQQEKEIELYGSLLRHDLRNDLGLILSYVDAVQMLMSNPTEEVASFLESALATVERMTNLLKNLGRPQGVRETSIVEFIEGIAKEAEESEKDLRIVFDEDHLDRDIRLTAGNLFALVFMNLFRNAAQHAGGKPVVTVSVVREEDKAIIVVSDNGPGVPEEFRKRLFTRGTSSKGEAGGLGLHLSREIITRTGGTIELLPQEEGQGAAFEIVIPLGS